MRIRLTSLAVLVFCFVCLFTLAGCGDSVASDRHDNTPRVVTIICETPGMSATDVETQVTGPLEVGLMGIPGVRRISAVARMGETVISIEFDHNTAIFRARQLVAEKIETISNAGALPKDVKTRLAPITSGRFLLVALSVGELPDDVEKGNKLATQLRDIADNSLRPQLLTISGVSQVTVIGGLRQQCEVNLSPEKLTAFGLTATDIVHALGKANADVHDAKQPKGAERIIRSVGQLQSVADIENTVLAIRDEKPIFVKDVAVVRVSSVDEFDEFGDEERVTKEKTIAAARRGVVLTIALQPDVDITKLGKSIDGALEATRVALPTGAQIGRTIDAPLEPLVDETQRALRRELPSETELEREKSDKLGEMLVATLNRRSVVKLFGSELAVLQREAAKCRKLIANVPGVVDVRVESQPVDPQLDFKLDRKAIARHGIAIHDVLDECRLALGGRSVSTVTLNDRPCDLVVKNLGPRDAPMLADKIHVRAKDGELIPLVRLIAIHIEAVPRSIHSEDTFQVLRVSFDTKDRDMESVRADIRAEVEKAIAPVQESLDEGYRIQFGWK